MEGRIPSRSFLLLVIIAGFYKIPYHWVEG